MNGVLYHALNSKKYSMKNWPNIMNSTGLDVIHKLARLGQRKQVCIQWIPPHAGVPRNRAADELAGRDCELPDPSSSVLNHSLTHSLHRVKINLT
ncbi:RNase H domain-containing protein [Trichonephila clavipes]|nr:RNase H domain-containing protein [Trichonephila clavipes]